MKLCIAVVPNPVDTMSVCLNTSSFGRWPSTVALSNTVLDAPVSNTALKGRPKTMTSNKRWKPSSCRFSNVNGMVTIWLKRPVFFQYVIHVAYRVGAFRECCFFSYAEREIEDTLPAAFAQYHRYAEVDVFLVVLAFEVHRRGKKFLLVAHDALHYRRRGGTWGIPRRRTDELGQRSAAHHGIGNNLI